MEHDVDFFVTLERGVWEALVSGDQDADRERLSESFLGVYPSGFSNRDDHADQLSAGPTMSSYEISEARLLRVADGAVLLAYLATFTPTGQRTTAQMYISSLWQFFDEGWRNTFSQDTPVE